MTFTYNLSDLSSANTTTKNRAIVRLRIGDTDSNHPLLADEELAPLLEASSNIPKVALQAARLALAKLRGETDTNGAGISANRSQKFSQYERLIVELKEEMATGAAPYLGGTSLARRAAIEANSDFIAPAFEVGRDDNRSGSSNADEVDR